MGRRGFLLRNVRCTAGGRELEGDLRISGGRIEAVGRGLDPGRRESVLDLGGYRVLPGLINAHDHLSLNLLPHLGRPPYPSIYHFAEEIYRPGESPIREIQCAAARDRLRWGGYKNLISGVTTVVHHDPFTRRVFWSGFPVRVLRRYGWIHSLGFGEDPAAAYRRAGSRPFILHAAEGTDEASYREVDRLGELGMLGANTVLVHGIALTPDQRSRLAEAGASLVWCPASNLRLYGKTAAVAELRGRIRLALGTDSTLTGSPTLLDELRAAAATGLATAQELLAMTTSEPARIFGLGRGQGTLATGAVADLIVVPDVGAPAAALLAARPRDLALVVLGGRPRLARPRVADELGLGPPNVTIEGAERWIYGDVGALKGRLTRASGAAALEANPLWSMLEPLLV